MTAACSHDREHAVSRTSKFGVDYAKLMNQSSGSDPSSMLRMLSQRHADPSRPATATVDGVQTTKYTGSAFVPRPPARRGVGSAVDVSKTATRHGRLQAATIAVWLDKGGLPRRMQMKMGGGAFDGRQHGHDDDVPALRHEGVGHRPAGEHRHRHGGSC